MKIPSKWDQKDVCALVLAPKKPLEIPYPVCSSFIRKDLKNNIKINIFLWKRKI